MIRRNTKSPAMRLAALACGLATTLALSSQASFAAPGPQPSPGEVAIFSNDISKSFADTFADPSVIQAKDGWWYAYSTADPLRAGDPYGVMHIARTRDWVNWEYMGTVFNETNRPEWAAPGANLWAPDIRYVQGQYVLYYTVMDTLANPGEDPAIGVATSPSPVGPWTPTDKPIIAPRFLDGRFYQTIDPSLFTDIDGQNYLYFGTYNGGVWTAKVSDDGLSATSDYTMTAIDNRYEGSYVVRHDDWYYLMASSANCCAGPTTGYSVYTGRSKSPLGPFVDADGISLTDSKVGGTIVVTQNGNRWIGAGHHAIATDTSGRDYLVYHALDRNEPWLSEPFGINRRPMLADRLDWINGWPVVRAGAGPSDSPQPAPVTGSALGITQHDPAAAGFVGLTGSEDPQGGATATISTSAQTIKDAPAGRARVRLDFADAKPVSVQLGDGAKRVTVTADPQRKVLEVVSSVGNRKQQRSDTLSQTTGWQTLIVEVDGTEILAQVSSSDLADPQAEVRLTHPGFKLGAAPVTLSGAGAEIDNFSVQSLAKEVTQAVAEPQIGELIAADEFDQPVTSADWSWVRQDADATVSGGSLNWPLQSADLVGGGNNAGVLLHETPHGNWIAETKLNLDLGETEVRNYQQAGIIAYASDDDFARLSSVSIWNTRQTEFGREITEPDGRTIFGGSLIGTPDTNVWLRLAHWTNDEGEHLYRAGTSRDGKDWTWGAVWAFDADTSPRIGLIAHGGENPATVAKFDYLRFYNSDWTGVDK